LTFFGAGTVESDPNLCRNSEGCQGRTQRHLHMQQHIKTAAFQCLMQIKIATPALGFIENHKLNAGQVLQQLIFKFTYHPSDFELGILALNGLHHRHSMTDVTDSR